MTTPSSNEKLRNYWNKNLPFAEKPSKNYPISKNINGVIYYGKSLEGKDFKKATRVIKAIAVIGTSLLILTIPIYVKKGLYRKVGIWTREVYHNQTLSKIHKVKSSAIDIKKNHHYVDATLHAFAGKEALDEDKLMKFFQKDAATIAEFMTANPKKWLEYSKNIWLKLKLNEIPTFADEPPIKAPHPITLLLEQLDNRLRNLLKIRGSFSDLPNVHLMVKNLPADLAALILKEPTLHYTNAYKKIIFQRLFPQYAKLLPASEMAKWIDSDDYWFKRLLKEDQKYHIKCAPYLLHAEFDRNVSSELVEKFTPLASKIQTISLTLKDMAILDRIKNPDLINNIRFTGIASMEDCKALQRFKNLTDLYLHLTLYNENEETPKDILFESISQCKELKNLHISTNLGLDITFNSASILAGLTHLNKLTIKNGRIDKPSLNLLKSIPELTLE